MGQCARRGGPANRAGGAIRCADNRRTVLRASRFFAALASLIVLVFGAGSIAKAQTIRYVDAAATGANNGTSWTDAFTDLQAALAAAGGGGYEIWVAEGTYKPSVPAGRHATFQLLDGVALYGGFAGGEESRDQRDWVLHETILSGDIGHPAPYDMDNSYHVLTGSGTDGTAVLDGFIVSGGNANGSFVSDYQRGGGFFNTNGSPTVSHCIFSGNLAYHGGGMYNYASSPTVTYCAFSDNKAIEQDGGGMYNGHASSPTVEHCTFSGNFAECYGGGMCNYASSPTVEHCTFSGNHGDDGGGMYNGHDSNPTVEHCTFSGNVATYHWGGGMYNSGGSPAVTECTFVGNRADDGGGMYNRASSSPTVTYCTFSDNEAIEQDGGGIYNQGGSPTLTGCTFEENIAHRNGGGMYNTESTPTLTDCVFSENIGESGSGGGVCSDTSDLSATGCTFSGNMAHHAGGGMYSTGSSLTVTGCDFRCNRVGGTGGGGMCNIGCAGSITACTFSDNEATDGGGIYNSTSDPAVTLCAFSRNAAYDGGGGMANSSSAATVADCTFSKNRADSYGGGMSNKGEGSYSWVVRCTFSDNMAVYGGGMGNRRCSPTVANCTFSDNRATWGGGMCNLDESRPTVGSCTFFGNSASDSGGGMNNNAIYVGGSRPTVRNTILAGNTPDDCFQSATSVLVSEGYNLESGTSCDCTEATDLQNTNPLLGPLANNGGPTLTHALLLGSPAIDAGSCDAATDQRGVSRPQPTTGACDVGAVEKRWFTLTVMRAGTGTGTVGSAPAGIDCGDACTAPYPEGTPVSLTASPFAHSRFSGWSGDAAGSDLTISVTMNVDKQVTATFLLLPFAPGDVNGDGAIDLLDVVLCRQIASGLVRGTAEQRFAADVDDDGDVDEDDVTILSEYVLGLRTTLP